MGRQHGDHNAPHPVGLGHQREEKLETTSRGPDRLDWSAVQTTPLGNAGRAKPSRCDNQPSPAREVATGHDPTPIEKQEKQTALHRAGYRYAGPDAIVPLQRNPPSDGVEPPNLDLSLAASQSSSRKHNARGPRLARRWTPPLIATPKTAYAGASPRPPQYSMSRILL